MKRLALAVGILMVPSVLLLAGGTGESGMEEPGPVAPELGFREPIPFDRAREIVLTGLLSLDPAVRRASIRMIRHAGGAEAFEAVQSLVGDFDAAFASGGILAWEVDAVETLHDLDPERTLAWLIEHERSVLNRLGPFDLFSIIGFDRVLDFDNLLYESLGSPSQDPVLDFDVVYMSEAYLAGDDTFETVVGNPDLSRFRGVDALAWLHEYRQARGLPLEPVYYALEYEGGVDPLDPVVARSFTLEELLAQALLYRFGATTVVYRTEFVVPAGPVGYSQEAQRFHGVSNRIDSFTRDPGELRALPSLVLHDALAHIYAGADPGIPADQVLSLVRGFPDELQFRHAGILASSPPSRIRNEILAGLAADANVDMRRYVFEQLHGIDPVLDARTLRRLIDAEDDPAALALLLELFGRDGNDPDLFIDYLDSGNPLVAVTAAGQILRSQR